MKRQVAICTAIATFFSGVGLMWSFFIGSIIWAQGGGAGHAIAAGIFMILCFVGSGFFVACALRSTPSTASVGGVDGGDYVGC